MNRQISILLVVLFSPAAYCSLEFGMIFMTKCISELIPASSQVELEYLAFDKEDTTKAIGIKIQVENPDGLSIHQGTGDSANITFKSTVEGEYKACFSVQNNAVASQTRLRIDWRIGGGQVDWDAVAKKEHLDEIDTIMKKYSSTMKEVSDALKELRLKEQEMRELNEATNTRVTLFSVLCMTTCVILAAGQVWYLRRFFTKKKII
eukprot:g1984.t1